MPMSQQIKLVKDQIKCLNMGWHLDICCYSSLSHLIGNVAQVKLGWQQYNMKQL